MKGLTGSIGHPAPEVENGSGDDHANHTQVTNENFGA